MGRSPLARSALVASLLAALLTGSARAEAAEITSPEDGAEVTSPLVVSVEFSCDYAECDESECNPTYVESLTLNVDDEPLEVREIEPCNLLRTEDFEVELAVGEHTLSADIVYPSRSWTSPEITVEVMETPAAATDGEDTDGEDEAGCGCAARGSSTPVALLSLLALPLLRRRVRGSSATGS